MLGVGVYGLYEGQCRHSIAFGGLTNASKILHDEHRCVKYSTEVGLPTNNKLTALRVRQLVVCQCRAWEIV
jgi:hypothetical protein